MSTTQSATANQASTARLTLLNIGCGPIQPPEWVNIDGSNRAWLASRLPWLDNALVRLRVLPPTEFSRQTRYEDVERGLKFPSDSVDAIYCGEILEHFTERNGRDFLLECLRVLKPGGILRVRVPDNYRFWKNYIDECEAARAKPREEWTTEHGRWVKMFFDYICVQRTWLGSYGHFHKWMYDEVTLIKLFEENGFVEVDRRTLHDSRIPGIEHVEVREELIVEGIKPGGAGDSLHIAH